MSSKKHISLVGAGLSGPVMAQYLLNQNYRLDIYERRSDMRIESQSAGRSINLALSKRGIEALRNIGIYDDLKSELLPMRGRMIHDLRGKTNLQPYGQKHDEVIYSVSRAFLNKCLMNHIEKSDDVKIHFSFDLEKIDLNKSQLIFKNAQKRQFKQVMGSDGSSSCIRDFINLETDINFKKQPLGHGYKELTIPPSKSGGFRMKSDALHIWPRGEFMLIALPNTDCSFTCTLFMPMDGATSFSNVTSADEINDLFNKYFQDIILLNPHFIDEYQQNKVSPLYTVFCDKYHYQDRLVIFGDSAHAIVPFFGQGMNASFQDCTVLDSLIRRFDGDWAKVFPKFSEIHVQNGHAIANMALENYVEMRDSVNNDFFKKRRRLEFQLENEFKGRFVPRYSMVSFHTLPYHEVFHRGSIQLKLMNDYLTGSITRADLHDSIMKKLSPI